MSFNNVDGRSSYNKKVNIDTNNIVFDNSKETSEDNPASLFVDNEISDIENISASNLDDMDDEVEQMDFEEISNELKEINIDISKINTLDDLAFYLKKNKMNELSQKYLGKSSDELDEKQLNYLLGYDALLRDQKNYQIMYDEQFDSDGIISDNYDDFKEIFKINEATRRDVAEARAKQTEKNLELLKALRGESEKSFEEVWKDLSGKEFDIDAINAYQKANLMYDFSQIGIIQALSFSKEIKNAESIEQLFNLYSNYYQNDETKVREEIAKVIKNSNTEISNNSVDMMRPDIKSETNQVEDVKIDKDNNVCYTYKNGKILKVPLFSINIRSDEFNYRFDDDFSLQYVNEYVNKFQSATATTYEAINQALGDRREEVIGDFDMFQKTVEQYCNSQEECIDNFSAICQTLGLGATAVGMIIASTGSGIPAGKFLIEAGSKMAFASTFLDNVLEPIDILTSDRENNDKLTLVSKQGLKCLQSEAADALYDALYVLIGGKINSLSGRINSSLINNTSKLLNVSEKNKLLEGIGAITEIGTDGVLAYLTSMILTDDIHFDDDGLDRFLGFLAGAAEAKRKTM